MTQRVWELEILAREPKSEWSSVVRDSAIRYDVKCPFCDTYSLAQRESGEWLCVMCLAVGVGDMAYRHERPVRWKSRLRRWWPR